MLPKDEKPHSNQLIGRLFKQNKKKGPSLSKHGLDPLLHMTPNSNKNMTSINNSATNINIASHSPSHTNLNSNKYLVPKITK